jgi:hypothetical protein
MSLTLSNIELFYFQLYPPIIFNCHSQLPKHYTFTPIVNMVSLVKLSFFFNKIITFLNLCAGTLNDIHFEMEEVVHIPKNKLLLFTKKKSTNNKV